MIPKRLYLNIHYGDIHTKFKTQFDITQENVPYVNDNVDLSKVKKEDYCREGDLIIADASEDYKDVGKAMEIIDLHGQKLISGLHTYIAGDKSNHMALGFKGYLMQTRDVRLQVMKMATGISVLGISKRNLEKVQFNLPCNQEQQKIATFLTSIDKKTGLVQTQLGQTQNFKKGLLQQMFV